MQQANVSPAATRKPGRPRSAEAEAAILDATLHLLAETMSVDQLSMEAIAARAGVGKATIYRRWPNKMELIVEAIKSLHPPVLELPPDNSVRDDLAAILHSLHRFQDDSLTGKLYLCMLVEEDRHPILMQEYFEQSVKPRREQLRAALARGISSGELRPDTDVETVLLCFSAVQTRMKLYALPLAGDVIQRVLDLIFAGISAVR